jgi:5-methyltetrahydrofolate--homocysteine methyltransferase
MLGARRRTHLRSIKRRARLEDQEQLLALLGADRIGITMSEGFQLHPEQSTSALVVHHPNAKYFTI